MFKYQIATIRLPSATTSSSIGFQSAYCMLLDGFKFTALGATGITMRLELFWKGKTAFIWEIYVHRSWKMLTFNVTSAINSVSRGVERCLGPKVFQISHTAFVINIFSYFLATVNSWKLQIFHQISTSPWTLGLKTRAFRPALWVESLVSAALINLILSDITFFSICSSSFVIFYGSRKRHLKLWVSSFQRSVNTA